MLFAIASSTGSATTTLFSVSNTGQTIIGDPSSTANVDAPIQVGGDANAWTFGYASADKSFRIASSTDLATSSTQFILTKSGSVGIGTTTPLWALTVSSSTAPQFALTDGALASDRWTWRNAGGNLYFATSSVSSLATTTLSAFTVMGATGNVGIGSSTPFAKLSVIGGGVSANGSVPSFVVATTSDWFGALHQRPLLWVTATTTGALDYARVAIGTTSPWGNSGLRDQLTVDGRIYSTWRYMGCDFFGSGLPTANIIADLTAVGGNVCGGFTFDADNDGQLIPVDSNYSNVQITPGQSATAGNIGQQTGDGAVVRTLRPIVSATTSPVMEVWGTATTSASATSTQWIQIGFSSALYGTDTVTLPLEGSYFISTTSKNWIAVTRVANVDRAFTNTGIAATSTTPSIQKMRIEMSSSTVHFVINGQVVAQHSVGMVPVRNLAPVVQVGIAQGNAGNKAGLAPRYRLSALRLWQDDPPGGGGGVFGGASASDQDIFNPIDGADIAEAYLSEAVGSYLPGLILANSTTTSFGVRQSAGVYDADIMGVVATSPYMVLGDETSATVRVGLVGRVPVIVSTENGPIKTGSRITSSSAKGVGMRAGRPGPIVGRALEAFDPVNGGGICNAELKQQLIEAGVVFTNPDTCVGRVTVFLEPGVDLTIGNMLQDAQEGILTLADAVTALTNTAFEQGAELTRFVAGQVVAQVGIFDKIFAKEVHTEKLCVGEVCVTEQEFLQMLQGAAGNAGGGSGSGGSGGAGAPDTEAPVITIVGNNPAEVTVGTTYADLGATVTDNVDQNLGITTLVNGVEMTTVIIDTGTAGEHTVTYTATDLSGNVGTATRTVIVTEGEPETP
ncbi:MAG: DUF5011 domain-containing protein, partial [Candidatus Pacebacteria bacterium]|nr:DUF5011 domain-containing protein [Candidatus Paceibacterota bacterium]